MGQTRIGVSSPMLGVYWGSLVLRATSGRKKLSTRAPHVPQGPFRLRP